MDKLKRCPICRRRPSIGKGGPGDLVWYIACDTQDDHVVMVYISGTREAAVARWNRRPAEDALVKALRELLRVDDDWHGSVSSEMSAARAAARALLEGK